MKRTIPLLTLFLICTLLSLKSFAVASISGATSLCAGSTIVLTDSTAGGTWSSSNPSAATISSGGIVTGVAAGTTTISYVVTGSGAGVATYSVTVNPLPATISGSVTTICIGSTAVFTDATSGGTWTSEYTYVATVSGSGTTATVGGVSTGTTLLSYTLPTGCYTTLYLTGAPTPTAGTISGGSTVCTGGTTTLTSSGFGGSWSSGSTSVATVGSSTGIVYGVSAGTAVITYTVTNSCGTARATYTVTVAAGASPVGGIILGSATLCPGTADTLRDSSGTTGGTWTSGTISVATVTSAGIVHGVAAGTSVITYTVSTSCATATAMFTVTVGTGASAGTISGATGVCLGSTTTLTDATGGGTWSSGSSAVATVDAGGVVYPITSGTATISYTVTGSCGTASATRSIAVAVGAGYITGPTVVCVGTHSTLADSAGSTGGIWRTGPGSVATITSAGVIYGVGVGTAIVTYTTFGSTCGTSSATYSVTISTTPTTRPINGSTIVCTGSSITLTDSTSGGAWTSRSTSIATISSGGVLTGITVGSDSVIYTVTNTCGSVSTARVITVGAGPSTGVITGLSSVCVGSYITLSDTAASGTWTSGSISVASVSTSGVVTGISSGTATISYTKTASCGTASATKVVTVNPLPSAGAITGTTSVCVGSTTTLTDASSGGTWTSGNTSVATVISSTGLVTGVAVGTSNITYTVTNTCGTAFTILPVSVVSSPSAGFISGLSAVCTAATINLLDTTATGTGTWSSSSSSVASVNASGVVRGNGVGSAVISYTVTTGCGTAIATRTVIVTTSAYAGIVNGGTSLCAGTTLNFNDTTGTGYGTWAVSNTSIATVDATGMLTGVSSGSVNISYTVSSTCGTASATKTISVISAAAGAITGATTVCTGATTSFTDGTAGGAWASGSTSIATVNSGGVVYGVAAGTATISYTVTNSCGTATATKTITVQAGPGTPATIGGPTTVCIGSAITLTDGTTGGAWSTVNSSIATINGAGVLTGVSAGVDTIYYTVSNTCGSSSIHTTVTVTTGPSGPAAITGVTSVCTGAATSLADATSGGAWSSVSSSIATVNTSGSVTGVSAGTTTISYTVTNSCGIAASTITVTVNPAPSGGTISGSSTVCTGVTTTFTDGVSGGIWSSANNAIATVSPTGVVTGVSSGSTTIIYTVTGTCGTATATRSITVNPGPTVAAITGSSTICPGVTTTFADATTGGIWTSSAASIATVSATGVVTGVAAGASIISYSVTNSCGTVVVTRSVAVSPGASAGAITGPTTVCTGSTTYLADTVTGGTWTSSNLAIATVSSSGVVSGVTVGTVTISYKVVNSCGTALTATVMSVGGAPVSGTISGPSALCAGTTITLSSTGTGGTWNSSNTAVATVSPAGVVSGVSGGTAVITYYVSSTCATAVSTATITVSPAGVAGTITGLATVCPGAFITLATSGASGGTWSSSNIARATVTSSGAVYGVSIGSLIITYQISNSCGTTTATKTITVNPLPAVSALTGPSAVCAGSTVTFTDSITGAGIGWLSSNTTIASVSSTGVVSGLAIGTATITYFLSNSCGTARTTKSITVNTLSAGAITGSSTVVAGSVMLLANSVTGGTWSSQNMTVATVTALGSVTGVAAGGDTIVYTITNSCGTTSAKKGITVTAHREEAGAPVAATQAEQADNIKVYPNPSNGTFVLEIPNNAGNATILITDLSGKTVEQRTSDENLLNFDMSQYAAGVYLLTINNHGQMNCRKLVIQ